MNIAAAMLKLRKKLFPRKRRRLELKFVSYAEADRLIRDTNGAWSIAPEEDNNKTPGMVFIERLDNE
jgi:hypothetical protein